MTPKCKLRIALIVLGVLIVCSGIVCVAYRANIYAHLLKVETFGANEFAFEKLWEMDPHRAKPCIPILFQNLKSDDFNVHYQSLKILGGILESLNNKAMTEKGIIHMIAYAKKNDTGVINIVNLIDKDDHFSPAIYALLHDKNRKSYSLGMVIVINCQLMTPRMKKTLILLLTKGHTSDIRAFAAYTIGKRDFLSPEVLAALKHAWETDPNKQVQERAEAAYLRLKVLADWKGNEEKN